MGTHDDEFGPAELPEIEPIGLDEVALARRVRIGRTRALVLGAVVAVLVAAVALPLTLREPGSKKSDRHDQRNHHQKHVTQTDALRAVASAVDVTAQSGSFHIAYRLAETPGTAPTPTSGLDCNVRIATSPAGDNVAPGAATVCMSSVHNAVVTGSGTISLNPKAMVSTSDVSTFGTVTVRVDDNNVWEYGGADYGLAPGSTVSGPGQPISGFAGLVEGTLGQREGAVAMMGLASPTGYLELTDQSLSSAEKIGTQTVDGVELTMYRVSISTERLAAVPGLTPEQSRAINDAIDLLHQEGYTGATGEVGIGADGFIHTASRRLTFSDGGVVTLDGTFSDFDCAGTVLMPGQTAGSTVPDPSCGATTTTTAPPSGSTPAPTTTPTTSPVTVVPLSPTTAESPGTTDTVPPTDVPTTAVASPIYETSPSTGA